MLDYQVDAMTITGGLHENDGYYAAEELLKEFIKNENWKVVDDEQYQYLAFEKKMNIKMIHRIILIYVLVDSFYNCSMYNVVGGQMSHIYKFVFRMESINPENICYYNIHIDLDEFNNINSEIAGYLLPMYKRIYTILYKYSEDKNFENIRDYESFKEIHRNIAERAFIRIKQIFGEITRCSIIAAKGVAMCSRVVGSVLSNVPCASIVSSAASNLYESALNVKDKTSRVLSSVKSSVTGHHPSLEKPMRDSGSDRPYVPPLAYGGSATRKINNKRSKYYKKLKNKHTKKC